MQPGNQNSPYNKKPSNSETAVFVICRRIRKYEPHHGLPGPFSRPSQSFTALTHTTGEGDAGSPRRAAAFPGTILAQEWLTPSGGSVSACPWQRAASLPHRDSLCNACLFRLHAGMKHLTHCAGAGARGGTSPSALCWLRSSAIKAVGGSAAAGGGGRGRSLFPTGGDLGQDRMLQQNPTPKICNNGKLNLTVTLKKGDNVIAQDTPSCFRFAIGAARGSGKPFYVFSSCWNIFHCRGENPKVPKSTVTPESALPCFMCC